MLRRLMNRKTVARFVALAGAVVVVVVAPLTVGSNAHAASPGAAAGSSVSAG